jgi:hypothetical protein
MLLGPLSKRILISHTLVASATDDNQIIEYGGATLRFGHIVAALKIKDSDGIDAPCRHAFSLEGRAHISDPQLFLDRLGYFHLVSHPTGVSA